MPVPLYFSTLYTLNLPLSALGKALVPERSYQLPTRPRIQSHRPDAFLSQVERLHRSIEALVHQSQLNLPMPWIVP